MQKGIPVPFSLNPLDPRFVSAKPIESAPQAIVEQLERQGDLFITRKRNGHAVYVAVTGTKASDIRLYSRGVREITDRFPAIIDELRSLGLPKGTLLAGELVIAIDGVDEPSAMSRYTLSHPTRSIELQKAENARIELAFFNVIARKGKIVVDEQFDDRLCMLLDMAGDARHQVSVVEVLDVPLAAAQKKSISLKWEGLVLYDRFALSRYALDGKFDQVPRPYGCWKWKEYLESDFVAVGWKPSTASSHFGQVKDLLIAQYDPESRELVDWGKAGKGISKKDRLDYMDPSLYPMVFEIKFERRTPNNRLINARIMRRRFDKKPEECVGPRL